MKQTHHTHTRTHLGHAQLCFCISLVLFASHFFTWPLRNSFYDSTSSGKKKHNIYERKNNANNCEMKKQIQELIDRAANLRVKHTHRGPSIVAFGSVSSALLYKHKHLCKSWLMLWLKHDSIFLATASVVPHGTQHMLHAACCMQR